jgi:hypothetical protein
MNESQRESLRQWRLQHPEYQKHWQREFKAWRDAERAANNNVKGNSRSRVSQSKLAYSVTVTNPLTEEEKKEGRPDVQPEPEPIRSATKSHYPHNAKAE